LLSAALARVACEEAARQAPAPPGRPLVKTDPAAVVRRDQRPKGCRPAGQTACRPKRRTAARTTFCLRFTAATTRELLFNCSLGKLPFYCACIQRVSQRTSNNERINAAKLNFPLIKPGKSGTLSYKKRLNMLIKDNLKAQAIYRFFGVNYNL